MDNVALNTPQTPAVMRMRANAPGTVVSKTLRAMVLPYQGGQAILPNNMVVEVLPYAPSLGIENAPAWVIGSMLWKAQPLPLVSLEFLASDGNMPEVGTHNRIIVVQALNNHPKLRHFGFVGSEAPRITEIDRDSIAKEMFLHSRPNGIASQVLLQGQPAIVPDIDNIEQTLSNVINSARSL